MNRRGNGEGSVAYFKARKLWRGQYRYTDADGTHRVAVYGKTRTEALRKLKEMRDRVEVGHPARDAEVTVADWIEYWIDGALEASDRKQTTKDLYATLARTHLKPAPFGRKTLAKLTSSDVERLLAGMRKAGKSPSLVRNTYTVIRGCLDIAVRDRLVRTNVAAAVRRPKTVKHEAEFLLPDEVNRLLADRSDERLRPLLITMIGTGVRRGEILAVRWSDIDLEARTLRITGTLTRTSAGLAPTPPKTLKSRRTIPLPDPVVAELRAQRARLAADRLRVGPAWHDLDLVFPNEVGGYWEPRNVQRRFESLVRRLDLGRVTLHSLRHTAATTLLLAGVPMKVVQELLGHSSFAVTADIYGHVSEAAERRAADELGAAFNWGEVKSS